MNLVTGFTDETFNVFKFSPRRKAGQFYNRELEVKVLTGR